LGGLRSTPAALAFGEELILQAPGIVFHFVKCLPIVTTLQQVDDFIQFVVQTDGPQLFALQIDGAKITQLDRQSDDLETCTDLFHIFPNLLTLDRGNHIIEFSDLC
jgi:hypothetical protein